MLSTSKDAFSQLELVKQKEIYKYGFNIMGDEGYTHNELC